MVLTEDFTLPKAINVRQHEISEHNFMDNQRQRVLTISSLANQATEWFSLSQFLIGVGG